MWGGSSGEKDRLWLVLCSVAESPGFSPSTPRTRARQESQCPGVSSLSFRTVAYRAFLPDSGVPALGPGRAPSPAALRSRPLLALLCFSAPPCSLGSQVPRQPPHMQSEVCHLWPVPLGLTAFLMIHIMSGRQGAGRRAGSPEDSTSPCNSRPAVFSQKSWVILKSVSLSS